MAKHSHECETADVGSFCDCDCAGGKHAVKRTVGGVPGAGGVSKAARAAAEKAGVAPVVNNRARPADGHKVAPGAPKSFKAAHAADAAKEQAGKKAVAQLGKDLADGRTATEGKFRKAIADSEAWSRERLAKIKADNPGISNADAIKKGRRDPEFKQRLAAHRDALAEARRAGMGSQDIDRIVAEERKKADKNDPVIQEFDKREADLNKRQADLDAKKATGNTGAATPPAAAKDLTPEQANVLKLIGDRYERKDHGSTAGMDPAAVDQLIKAGVIRRSAGDGPTVHLNDSGHRLLADLRGDDKHKAVMDEWDAARAASRKAAAPWKAAKAAGDQAKMDELDPAFSAAGSREVGAQNAVVRHLRAQAERPGRKPAAATAGKTSLAGATTPTDPVGDQGAPAVKVPAPLRDILAVVDNPDKHMDTAAAARYQKLTREHMKLMSPQQKQGMLDDLRSRAANGYKPQSPTGQKLNRAFNTLVYAGADFKAGMVPTKNHQVGVGDKVTHGEHGHGRVVERKTTEHAAVVDFGDKKVTVAQSALTFGHVGDDVNPEAKAAGRAATKAAGATDSERARKTRLAGEFASDRHSTKATTEALFDAEVSADDFKTFSPAVQAGARKRMEGLAQGQYVDPALKARAAATLKRWDGDAGEAAASQARRDAAPAPMAKLAQDHVDGKGGYLESFNKLTEYQKSSFDALNDRDKKTVEAALEKQAGRGGAPGRRAAERLKDWTGRTVDVKPDPMPDHVRQAHRALNGQSTNLPRSYVYADQSDAVLRAHFTPEERAKMRADGGRILDAMRPDAPDRAGLAAAMDRIDKIDGPPGSAKPAGDGVKVATSRRGRGAPSTETTPVPGKTDRPSGESITTVDNASTAKDLLAQARIAERRSMQKGLSPQERQAARQEMNDLERRAFDAGNPHRTAGPGAETFKGKKVATPAASRLAPLEAIAADPSAKVTPGQAGFLTKYATSGMGTHHLNEQGHRVLAAMRGDGAHQQLNEKVHDATQALEKAERARQSHGAVPSGQKDRYWSQRSRELHDDFEQARQQLYAAQGERKKHLAGGGQGKAPSGPDVPAKDAGAPASVADIKPGFTYTDGRGNTVTITEAPTAGKSKWFRCTSSDRPGRSLLITPTQLAADTGLPRDKSSSDTPATPPAAADPIAVKEAEVKRLSDAYVAHGQSQAGSGSMRTKRFGQQVDAHLRRSVALGEQLKKAEADLAALKNPKPVSVTAKPAGSFTPDDLGGKKFIKTRYGWFEVVKVNRTSVKVKGGQGPGNPESILIKKIIDAR